MKVYAVIGGTDYEGEDFSTLRLFDCFSTATAYCEHLGEQMDYALIDTREVSMESSITAATPKVADLPKGLPLHTTNGITTPW